MKQLTEHIFAETEFLWANVGAAMTEEGAVMIDCPVRPTDSRRWQENVRSLTGKDIRYLICTDFHGDHMTGAAFVKDVTLIASERVYEQLTRPDLTHRFSKQTYIDSLKDLECHEEAAEIEAAVVPLPQFCFEDSMILHLSPLTFKIHRLGGHTPACSVVHVPDEGILFGSDVLITEPCPGLRDGSVGEWLRALEWIDRLPVDTIVPGHGEVCGKEEVRKLKAYLSGLWEIMERLVRADMGNEKAAADPAFEKFFWADTSRGTHWVEHRRFTFRKGLERLYDEIKGVG